MPLVTPLSAEHNLETKEAYNNEEYFCFKNLERN